MHKTLALTIACLSLTPGCKSAKADFQDNVCGALAASGGTASAPTKDDLAKAMKWAGEHVTHSDLQRVVKMVSAEGVDGRCISSLIRLGGSEYASFEGACALAEAYEKVYPCPADDPPSCCKKP